jgi:hypothetical protein
MELTSLNYIDVPCYVRTGSSAHAELPGWGVAREETWVGSKQASNSRLNTRMKALWFKGHIKFDINYLNTKISFT